MSDELHAEKRINKKGLGRGLGSLLGEQPRFSSPADLPIDEKSQRVWTIAIEKIQPNGNQPRKHFDREKLNELAQSIKENGIILPIVARKLQSGNFEIIAGERRWRAAQIAGLKEVPVVERAAENKETLELALVENVQRDDLNALEEAEAYAELATRYALSQQQIADKVGKDRVTVANLIRLINLAPEVKTMVRNGDLQLGQAKVLLSVADQKLQTQLAKKAIQLNLSVRALEKLAAGEQKPKNVKDDIQVLTAINQLTQELKELVGTKVVIQSVGKTRSVSLTFYSDEELNQFVDKLRKSMR